MIGLIWLAGVLSVIGYLVGRFTSRKVVTLISCGVALVLFMLSFGISQLPFDYPKPVPEAIIGSFKGSMFFFLALFISGIAGESMSKRLKQ